MGLAAGEKIPLSVQLGGQRTDRYVRAKVVNAAGTALDGSPFTLTHDTLGWYRNHAVDMPSTSSVSIRYEVYSDSDFTTPVDDENWTSETITLRVDSEGGGDSDSSLGHLFLTAHLTEDSTGPIVQSRTIHKGEDCVIPVKIRDENNDPFDLTDYTEITARLLKNDRTYLEVTLTDEAVEVIGDPVLGKLRVILTEEETDLLKADEKATLELVMEAGDDTTIVQVPNALRIKSQI
jgi:hypothetical protein